MVPVASRMLCTILISALLLVVYLEMAGAQPRTRMHRSWDAIQRNGGRVRDEGECQVLSLYQFQIDGLPRPAKPCASGKQ
jgi:hypothetical protein